MAIVAIAKIGDYSQSKRARKRLPRLTTLAARNARHVSTTRTIFAPARLLVSLDYPWAEKEAARGLIIFQTCNQNFCRSVTYSLAPISLYKFSLLVSKQWNLRDLLNEVPRDWQNLFVISEFFSIHLSITRLKNMLRFSGVFVIYGFVISGSHCIIL